MKRRLAMAAAVVAIAALVAVVAFARARSPHLVRVGGDGNACNCTHRIEP